MEELRIPADLRRSREINACFDKTPLCLQAQRPIEKETPIVRRADKGLACDRDPGVERFTRAQLKPDERETICGDSGAGVPPNGVSVVTFRACRSAGLQERIAARYKRIRDLAAKKQRAEPERRDCQREAAP